MQRTLTFRFNAAELTKSVNLVMTFEPPAGLSSDSMFAAWKVAELHPGGGSSSFIADYSGRLGFSAAQVDSGNIIHPGSALEMQVGQQAEFTATGWKNPTAGQPELIEAWNASGRPQAFTVGSVTGPTGDLRLVPTFLWNVGNTLGAQARFHPTLLLYVSMDVKQNSTITGDVRSRVIKTIDFSKIMQSTEWRFIEKPDGSYEITQIP
ncbi:hypothetical protein L218DRAFT_1016026 [Marasmius fiardii PR-910]|nr:hypothetical protein L218DRAFT_1016026 [Marasmius fiardii PR-910]